MGGVYGNAITRQRAPDPLHSIQLHSQVFRDFPTVDNFAVDRGSTTHPQVSYAKHKRSIVWVARLVRPFQTFERKDTHVLNGVHIPYPSSRGGSTDSLSVTDARCNF